MFKLYCVLLFLFTIHSSSYAQSDTNDVSLFIDPISQLQMSNSFIHIDLSSIDAIHAYNEGFVSTQEGSPTLTINSNTGWTLLARVSSNWTNNKSLDDLQIKFSSEQNHQTDFATFKSLSLVDQEVASHSAGVSADTYRGTYKVLLDWKKDKPGNYHTTILYTLRINA